MGSVDVMHQSFSTMQHCRAWPTNCWMRSSYSEEDFAQTARSVTWECISSASWQWVNPIKLVYNPSWPDINRQWP